VGAWSEAVATAPAGKVTAAHVAEVVKRRTTPEVTFGTITDTEETARDDSTDADDDEAERKAANKAYADNAPFAALAENDEAARVTRRQENRERALERCETTEDINSIVASGQKFACIYADPPWQYGNQSTRGSTDNHYPTMTLDDIAALPVGELAAEQCHLWLWTTNGFLFDCPKLFDAWGFEFKSSYVWCKTQIGMGNYLRNAHEFLLLAVRGGLTGAVKDVRSWGEFPRAAHSAKPEPIRQAVIERLSPGPRLELFGRRTVPGWTVWGNQVEKGLLDASGV
jgi:N6-adenosine-specific RNA methylase IME4